jgi:hypothetical protein
MGRYSNPGNVARLRRILSGQGRDRVSHRPVPSLRRKQTRLTDSQRSELVERYQAGESAVALAATFGIDRRTATRLIRAAGAEVRYRLQLTDVDVDVARELYEQGLSLVYIGVQLGVAARTVLNMFRRAGVPTRAVGTNQWSRRAAESLAQGELGDSLGIG